MVGKCPHLLPTQLHALILVCTWQGTGSQTSLMWPDKLKIRLVEQSNLIISHSHVISIIHFINNNILLSSMMNSKQLLIVVT